MKTPTRFVQPLSADQRNALQQILQTHPSFRTRSRAHAVLLSDKRYSVDQLADIFEVDRETISAWLTNWQDLGSNGLDDNPRSGRPTILNPEEQAEALRLAKQEPRAPHHQLPAIEKKTGKRIARQTLKRLLKKARMVWKRMRRSLRGKRNEEAFRLAQQELSTLRGRAAAAECDLYFYDEAGFSLQPCVPYGWQAVNERIELPSALSRRQNVLGFMGLQAKAFHSFVFEGGIDSSTVVHCFEVMSRLIERETWVVMDNAPTHTSEEFEDEMESWEKRGLHIYFLPPYCPELNLIEILWRKIKYEWLPLSAYESYKSLCQGLDEVLSQVGSKYQITFV